MPYSIGQGSGTLATAGGLLFHGEPDGNFQAYDAKTGTRLWQWQTGAGADAPAVTYEIDGVQYVAIASGGVAIQTSSANGDMVWAFSLQGSPGNRLAEFPAPKPPATGVEFAGGTESRRKVRRTPAKSPSTRAAPPVTGRPARAARPLHLGSAATALSFGAFIHQIRQPANQMVAFPSTTPERPGYRRHLRLSAIAEVIRFPADWLDGAGFPFECLARLEMHSNEASPSALVEMAVRAQRSGSPGLPFQSQER